MKKKIGKIVFAIVILAFLLIQVYPIIWLFMASVKPTIELSTTPFALPKVLKSCTIGLIIPNYTKRTWNYLYLCNARPGRSPYHERHGCGYE